MVVMMFKNYDELMLQYCSLSGIRKTTDILVILNTNNKTLGQSSPLYLLGIKH